MSCSIDEAFVHNSVEVVRQGGAQRLDLIPIHSVDQDHAEPCGHDGRNCLPVLSGEGDQLALHQRDGDIAGVIKFSECLLPPAQSQEERYRGEASLD